MNPYKHTQTGYLTLAIFGVVLTANICKNWGHSTVFTTPLNTFLFLVGSMFSTLTIRVRESKLQWFFGPKFWRKTLNLPDIVETKVVKNRWWFGFGVRLTQHGWLYNVSGMRALELSLKNGKRIRLGTDEPEKLQAAITAQSAS